MKGIPKGKQAMFIEQIKASIEQKEKLEWSREVSSGFVQADIIEIVNYKEFSGTFYIHFNFDHTQLFSFEPLEDEPTMLNLRETEELLKWAKGETDQVICPSEWL